MCEVPDNILVALFKKADRKTDPVGFSVKRCGSENRTFSRLGEKNLTITVGHIIDIMETIAPSSLTEEWDNVGLQLGHPSWPVNKVWVALDPSVELVERGSANGVNLLITHHPLIFRPLSSVDPNVEPGRIVGLALEKEVAIFCAHTNLDIVGGGVNDMLAQKIGLGNVTPLSLRQKKASLYGKPANHPYSGDGGSRQPGLGRIGDLPQEISLESLVQKIKEIFQLKTLKVAGDLRLRIKRVAICSGSGASLVNAFLHSDAQVYVSGDLGYHEGRIVEARGRALIDIGHFASEHIMVQGLVVRLKEAVSGKGYPVCIEAYTEEKDCFQYI